MGRRKIPRYTSDTAPLELDEAAMRRLVEAVGERLIEHVATLGEQPVHATKGGKKLAASLKEPMPDRGAPLERVLRLLFGRVIPATLNTASPGYLAYIPGGGLFQSAVADWIALATNRYAGVWLAAPGLVQLEQNVIDWFCAELGLPPKTSGGLLVSGGSIANLIAIVTARRERLPPSFLDGVLYVSDQAHHSIAKAALFAGFPVERIRAIGTDARMKIDIGQLERAIASDAAAGLRPFCIVGNAGTTNTGAVDDLDALADVAARTKTWFHVDAAYGGFFAFTKRGKVTLRGISRADSVTLDPHKGLFVPYGTGCLLVRDREALRRAHSVRASYMPPMQTDADLVDFCELGPELSREARGLRVWLPLKLHGAKVFREALDEKLDLARFAADELRKIPGVELVTEPELSLFAFRYKPPGQRDEAALEALNREILAAINERQRVLLTSAMLEKRFVLRICVLSFRTHLDRMQACVEDVRAAIAQVASSLR